MPQAEPENTSTPTPNNVIYLSERIAASVEKRLPLLEASGVCLEPTHTDQLSQSLSFAVGDVLWAADILIGKRKDIFGTNPQALAARAAALLYRSAKQFRLSVDQAEKLERKLRKAKKKAAKCKA